MRSIPTSFDLSEHDGSSEGENLGCPDEAEKEGGERGERGKKRGKKGGRKKKKNCRRSRQNIIFNHNSNKMIIHFPSSTNHVVSYHVRGHGQSITGLVFVHIACGEGEKDGDFFLASGISRCLYLVR